MPKVAVWWCLIVCGWNGGATSHELKEDIPVLQCPPNVNASQCLYKGHQADEFLFSLQGKDVTVKYGAKHFKLSCPQGINLEDGILPAFAHPTAVPTVTLKGCTPPAALAPALAALNVSLTTLTDLTLRALPALPAETLSLCSSLNLTLLELEAVRGRPTLFADTLKDCTGLVTLRLMGVIINLAALNLLPVSLKQLALCSGSLEELPPTALQRLTILERLEIQSDRLRNAPLAVATNLRAVVIRAPLSNLTIAAKLENVTLSGGAAAVVPNGTCNVRSLRLGGAPENATTEWLRSCGQLKALTWYCAARGTAGRIPLPPAASLENLRVYRCRLDLVNEAWLRGAPALSSLELMDHAATALPRELLVWNVALRSLSLRSTELNRESVRALEIAELLQLRELDLSDNPSLGDLCGGGSNVDVNAVSALVRLRALRVLKLRGTNATRLCPDWRRDLPALNLLDLRKNNISRLQEEDLQWSQESVTVELCDNPLETVSYSGEQYRAALVEPPSRVNVGLCKNDILAPTLRCDCDVYWFAHALRDRPGHAPPALAALRCPGGTLLRDTPLEDLTCPVPAPPCPHACRCAATGEAVSVSCNRAELDAVPSLPSELPVRTLDLSHNALTRLGTVALPANLTLLDVSHNRLQLVDLEEVEAALNASRLLRIAGNPLRCECAAREAMAALIAASPRIEDWSQVRCSDGVLIAALQPGALCARPALTAALVTLLAATAFAMMSIAVFLTSRRARKRIKWFLWWRWRGAEIEAEEVDAKDARYEAFVSFATNEAGRAAKLAARLESQGRRLCLHHRDWAPGELITEQIARSVRDSRRTIVLLSDAFLDSAWARAEFRAAWALTQRERKPRLLLVLLPELTVPRSTLAAALPADLSVAVATCTYLEWDEPRFWERLERAVPLPLVSVASPDENASKDAQRY
ncbi:protein toll-like [Pieris brassicae]|uniref:protein toll-like n=1 Tax=Pieris brassicae TaxID=7116 RepID=UPI001E65F22B|nr:protein toll-like [Pieris brassicae]